MNLNAFLSGYGINPSASVFQYLVNRYNANLAKRQTELKMGVSKTNVDEAYSKLPLSVRLKQLGQKTDMSDVGMAGAEEAVPSIPWTKPEYIERLQ